MVKIQKYPHFSFLCKSNGCHCKRAAPKGLGRESLEGLYTTSINLGDALKPLCTLVEIWIAVFYGFISCLVSYYQVKDKQ